MQNNYHERAVEHDERQGGYDRVSREYIYKRSAVFTRRGPRGYRRADARIREDINECLARHGEIDASRIQVSVDDGEVTLSGVVGSREERRLAGAVAEACLGVKDAHNRLRVDQTGRGERRGLLESCFNEDK